MTRAVSSIYGGIRMKSIIICFLLSLVSLVVTTSIVTAIFLGVANIVIEIILCIFVPVLICTSLYSIPKIISTYIVSKS